MRESRVHASDLILPVFVLDGHDVVQDVASMPGVQRVTLDRLYPVAEIVTLCIPVLALFPVLEPSLKTTTGARPQSKGLARVCARAEEALSPSSRDDRVPLDPFTITGQDGLLDRPATSSTTRPLRCRQAIACMPRPAWTSSRRRLMVRIGAIRTALEAPPIPPRSWRTRQVRERLYGPFARRRSAANLARQPEGLPDDPRTATRRARVARDIAEAPTW